MRLVRAELLKISTTSVWWVFGLVALALWGITYLVNWFQSDFLVDPPAGTPTDDPGLIAAALPVNIATNLYTTGQFLGLMIVMVIGVIVVTNEFFHQTATTTFLTTPHRTAVIAAKLVAAAIIGVIFWLATTALNLVLTPLVLTSFDLPVQLDTGPVWRAIALNGLAYLLWAIIGVGFGVLIRSQLAATLVTTIGYIGGFFGAVIVFSIFANRFGDWFDNLQLLVPPLASGLMVSGTELPGSPPQWSGAVVLIGYALVAGVIGTFLTRRRDIS